jgi:uncharacterized protein
MVLPKRTLVRLVRTSAGVQVDPTGKLPGRGAYLHNVRPCWEKGLKGPLPHALKTELTPDDLDRLHQFMQTLPDGEEAAGE